MANACCRTCWTKNYRGCLNRNCQCHDAVLAVACPQCGAVVKHPCKVMFGYHAVRKAQPADAKER